MKYLYCLLICLHTFFVLGQLKNDLYDLNFGRWTNIDFPWNLAPFRPGEGGCSFFSDSLHLIRGKIPLGFRSLEMMPGSCSYFRFSVYLSQYMYIPDNYHQVAFVLNTKCLNVSRGWLKVTSLDAKENYLRKDSVEISNTGEWNECVLELPGKGVSFFGVEICAEGDDNWLKASGFYIDHMQILGDNRAIDWSEAVSTLSDKDFDYSGLWPESVLSRLKNKRVIALAETVHGDSAIVEAESKLVSLLVKRGECKLILMEIPFDRALLYNLYIQGNPEINEAEILQYAENMLFRSGPVLDLLNELRDYNRLHTEKVYLVGIDRMSWESRYLSRFLECVSGKDAEKRYADFINLIYDGKTEEAMQELINNGDLTEGWEKMNIYWLRQALEQLSKQKENRRIAIGMEKGREKIMKDNVIAMVDSLLPSNKQSVIIGHWFHFNKINNIVPLLEKSSGYDLNQRFGDEYLVIGILKGEGELLGRTFGMKKTSSYSLNLPVGTEFLENLCSRQPISTFVGCCRIPGQVGWLRLSGSYASRIFSMPMALSQRMDCFLWIK